MGDINIRIPAEIKDYSEKMGGFTLRQWIGIVFIVITCVPFSIYCNLNDFGACSFWFSVVVGGIVAMICFVKINGLTFEKMFPFIKRSFVIYYAVLPKCSAQEALVYNALTADKTYVKMRDQAQKIKNTTPEYLWGREVKEFEHYEQVLFQALAPYVINGESMSSKQVKKIARQVRRNNRY